MRPTDEIAKLTESVTKLMVYPHFQETPIGPVIRALCARIERLTYAVDSEANRVYVQVERPGMTHCNRRTKALTHETTGEMMSAGLRTLRTRRDGSDQSTYLLIDAIWRAMWEAAE